MIGGVFHADQVNVGPPVQIRVLAADVAVACVAGLALAAEHGVSEVAKVVASGVFVAVVASVQAGVPRRAHL